MDLDGDGKKEVISGSWPGEIYVFRRKPNGTYGAPEKLKDKHGSIIKVGQASAVALADWDEDGDQDLAVGVIEGGVFFFRNEGTAQKPAFGRSQAAMAAGGAIKVDSDAGPCLADWDKDGKLDLLLGAGNGAVTWHRNAGTKQEMKLEAAKILVEAASSRGESTPGEFDQPKRSGMRSKIAVTDWNGDGISDLVVGDFHSRGTRNYHGWVWVYPRKTAPVTAQADRR